MEAQGEEGQEGNGKVKGQTQESRYGLEVDVR